MRKGKDPELDPDPDPYIWLMDTDPGSPKTCKSCGSGSPELIQVPSLRCYVSSETLCLVPEAVSGPQDGDQPARGRWRRIKGGGRPPFQFFHHAVVSRAAGCFPRISIFICVWHVGTVGICIKICSILLHYPFKFKSREFSSLHQSACGGAGLVPAWIGRTERESESLYC